MEDQRLRPAFADPLPQAGSADEISRDLFVFPLSHFPRHDFAAPDIDHQIEVEPDATNAGGQVGDVPAPDLIGLVGPQAWNGTRLLRRARPPAAVGLPMGMEHPIEAALRADIEALIGQDRNDLPRRQGGEFRLVAGEQDPLALLLRKAVRHQAGTAFTAIQAVAAQFLLQPFDLPLVLLVALLEVLLIGHRQQRLGIGILGGLAPAGQLLGEQSPLSAVSTQFSRIESGGLQYNREFV